MDLRRIFVLCSAAGLTTLGAPAPSSAAAGTATLAYTNLSHSACVEADEVGSQQECQNLGPLNDANYSATATESATATTGTSATASAQLSRSITSSEPPANGTVITGIGSSTTLTGTANNAEDGVGGWWGSFSRAVSHTRTGFAVSGGPVSYSLSRTMNPDANDCTQLDVELRGNTTSGAVVAYRRTVVVDPSGCVDDPDPDAGALTGSLEPGDYELEVRGEASANPAAGAPNASYTATIDVSLSLGSGPLPALSVSDVTLEEGDDGATDFDFTVSRPAPAGGPVSVDYEVVGVTAAEDVDLVPHSGTLQFNDGQLSHGVTVVVEGDRLLETDETFHVVLSDPVDATIADGIGIGTIVNDDACDNAFTAGRDIIDGTPGDDVLCGGDGSDDIDGRGGHDQIIGGDGHDTLEGRDGNDIIEGGAGEDLMLGSDGADTLTGGGGPDDLRGGAGEDTIGGATEFGGDTIRGGTQGDIINGGPGDDSVNGDDGGDLIVDTSGADAIHGGAGGDEIDGSEGPDRIWGDGGRDTLTGGDANDRIWGDNQAILIDDDSPADYDDIITGGPGFDLLRGGPGGDSIEGGADDDELYGHDSADGDGEDTIEGGLGDDTIIGGPRDDILHGQAGVDTIEGNAGGDIINAGPGSDINVNGGDGGDLIIGHDGNDRLTGGFGEDDISGNAGTDHFRACDGEKDTLRGGANTDKAGYDGLDIRLGIEELNPC